MLSVSREVLCSIPTNRSFDFPIFKLSPPSCLETLNITLMLRTNYREKVSEWSNLYFHLLLNLLYGLHHALLSSFYTFPEI